MGLLNDCPRCYEQTINQCVDQLIFVLGLTAGETYFFTFTDNHSKEHIVEVVADVDGNVTIDTTEFPEGFFIVYSGSKVVTWRQSGCEDLCFTPCDGETEYCCITLRPIDKSGDFEDVVIETIPCCDAVLVEAITFESVDFQCSIGDDGVISGVFSVQGGSGNYAIQAFRIDTWINYATGVGANFSFLINNPPNAIIQTRIYDLDTDVFSNELPLTTTNCPL